MKCENNFTITHKKYFKEEKISFFVGYEYTQKLLKSYIIIEEVRLFYFYLNDVKKVEVLFNRLQKMRTLSVWYIKTLYCMYRFWRFYAKVSYLIKLLLIVWPHLNFSEIQRIVFELGLIIYVVLYLSMSL